MAIQRDMRKKSTRTKVCELIRDLENDLQRYKRLARSGMIPQQEAESVQKSIMQSIADLRSIRFANGEIHSVD